MRQDKVDLRLLFAEIILCLAMSGFDAVATVRHISLGLATELNPAMDYFIHHGFIVFFSVKIGITAGGMLILYHFANYRTARQAVTIFTVFYSLLTVYHCCLYQLY